MARYQTRLFRRCRGLHSRACQRWVEAGNNVTIFCGNDNKNLSNETIDGVEIIRRGGTFSVYAYAAIYYLLKFRKNVDLIIDCENGIPFFTPLFARVPVILLIHHVHQEIFREFLKFPARQIAAFLEGKLMPFVYKNKQIVTVSSSSMQEILRMGISTQNRIEIIPNGVNSADYAETQKTLYPSFMYLGRLKNYKNIDVALKAFANVQAQYSNAVFSIVGSGETYPKLKKLVEKLNLEENVRFLGKVTEAQKTKLLQENWLMLQPSQMEGWGITVIEANACGTPVIASRVNGLKDSVIDGKTGLLVQPKNVDQFSEAMVELVKNNDFRSTLSENAYAWSQNFSWNKSANVFQLLIDKCINDETQINPTYAGVVLSGQES